jgi:hypothetical protein
MDWVRSRHPEDGFDPDTALDSNDPRIKGASRRTATDYLDDDEDAVPPWPQDMSHHLDEPTGYSAGYAAHSHPDFRDPTDDSYGREYEDLENSYHAAGGTGEDFEEGVNDAANGISHKLDDPENYHGYQAEEAAWRKRNRDSVHQQQQDKHNRLREQGDITDFNIHEGPEFPGMPGVKKFDYSPRYSPWKSEKHPEGSWEGCPTCSDNGYGPKPVDYVDPDDDPFDPRRLGGMHARYAAAISGVSEAVQRRIAAELSPPCPDCGQVAGFDTHPVSDRILVCRNCEYPMTDEGHDGLLDQTLSGHDRAISSLPEVDHPSLGRHGGLSYEDTMKLIDDQLAAGEPPPRHEEITKGVPAWHMGHDDDDGPYDDPSRECDACGSVDNKHNMYVTDSEKDGSLQWHCDPCAERIYQNKLSGAGPPGLHQSPPWLDPRRHDEDEDYSRILDARWAYFFTPILRVIQSIHS